MKAFIAFKLESNLVNQKLINKNEDIPINSQPINNCNISLEITKIIIDKVNKLK